MAGEGSLLRVGSRKSELALIQTKYVISLLQKIRPEIQVNNYNNNLFKVFIYIYTVKALITNTSKEVIKFRILHFLIMEFCRYLVF